MTLVDAATAGDIPDARSADALVAAMRAWDVERLIGDLDGADAEGTAALAAATSLGNPLAIAHARFVTGSVHAFRGALDRAEADLAAALAHFTDADDRWGMVAATARMNLIWAGAGDHRTGIDRLTAILPDARTIGDPSIVFAILNDLQLAHRSVGDFDLAIGYALEAHGLADRIDRPVFQFVSRLNLGSIYTEHHDSATAATLYREALAIADAHPDYQRFAMHCEHNLGVCADQEGDHAEALRWFERAAASATRFDAIPSIIASRYDAGVSHRRLGNRAEAVQAFHEVLATIERTHQQDSSRAALARWQIESLEGAWTRDTVNALQAVLDDETLLTPVIELDILGALAEASEHLGDTAAAIGSLRTQVERQEAYWRAIASRQSHMALQLQRTHEAQQAAQQERQQREAMSQALREIVELNTRNEELVAQLTAQSAVLDRLAREDGLTGIANRRAFDEHLQGELSRSRAFGRPLAVVLADIDDFKQINDRYSHQTGDRVLIATATILTQVCRDTDIVARYGGEEFGLILLEVGPTEAHAIVERIRAAMHAHDWAAIAPGLAVTLSFGIVTLPRADLGDTLDPATIVTAVDDRLYQAKRAGKNRSIAD